MTYRQVTFSILGLALVTFLTSGCADSGKMKKLESENARLNQLILQKDASLKTLMEQAQAKQIELETVKKELDIAKSGLGSVKKELDGVDKKLNNVTTTPAVP